jgi:glucosamine-6-phosphate deaminase
MEKYIFESKDEMGLTAAQNACRILCRAIHDRGQAAVILATGASQFDVLKHLVTMAIDWSKVTMFHLDEYIGIPASHPASFRKYLLERFVKKVSPLRDVHLVNGDHADPVEECRRLNALIQTCYIDVTLAGIGENGHLAFNDPPADFEAKDPYIVVDLDDACRKQQLGEGWFACLADVPKKAISMSIPQIMKTKTLILSVPDKRKADAVKKTVEGPISPLCPASIARQHPQCMLLLDREAASLLKE